MTTKLKWIACNGTKPLLLNSAVVTVIFSDLEDKEARRLRDPLPVGAIYGWENAICYALIPKEPIDLLRDLLTVSETISGNPTLYTTKDMENLRRTIDIIDKWFLDRKGT